MEGREDRIGLDWIGMSFLPKYFFACPRGKTEADTWWRRGEAIALIWTERDRGSPMGREQTGTWHANVVWQREGILSQFS